MATQAEKKISKWAIWVMGLVVSAHLVSVTHSTVTCAELAVRIMSCAGYVVGTEDKPSDACCSGASEIEKIATSKPDLIATCKCLKQAATSFPIDFDRVNQIPKLCNLKFNIPVNKDTDCDKL